MSQKLEFGLLGSLLIRCDGQTVPLPRGKERTLLAVLLLHAGQVVSVDYLTQALWDSSPPRTAAATLKNYVKRLRMALGEAGRSRICTLSPGYAIRIEPGELDITRFQGLTEAAKVAAAAGAWDLAAGHAREALVLWRGEPLADIDSELLAAREVPRLAELWLHAAEARIDADLHLGRHADVIGELIQLSAAHPHRERLHALLMLALYRAGRQADALAAYQRVRDLLNDELGVEPGAILKSLHQQILAADPVLAAPEPAQVPRTRSAKFVPRELPALARHFIGRSPELATLTAMLDSPDQASQGVAAIAAIGGTAGVGKTALAVRWAHEVAERFPDGQLYVNLRGYDPDEPVPAADALTIILRTLGVPGHDIPATEDERAARYRSLLAARRILVVIDNAATAEHVRPLLPASQDCMVVVTSRDSLTGLVARDGAVRLELDRLCLAAALELLRALIGGRVDAEPAAAAVLAELCERLPLALRVAAELAAFRSDVTLAELAAEMAREHGRLHVLDADGDPRSSLRAVLSWSYRYLDSGTAQMFRLLSLHPGPSVDSYAAAALAGCAPRLASHRLGQLARAHLIQATGRDLYVMHDLLRAYASDLAAEHDGADSCRTALTRLFDHYLHVTSAMKETLFPGLGPSSRSAPGTGFPASAVSDPPFSDPEGARGWLAGQLASLIAVVRAAADAWPGHAIALATTLYFYLDRTGRYPEAIAVHRDASRAARATGDRAAEAIALTNLGTCEWRTSRYEDAVGHLRQALALHREIGDQAGQARALGNLGLVALRQGRHQQSVTAYRQAMELYREGGNRAGEAKALVHLAIVAFEQGRFEQGSRGLGEALALYREIGDEEGQADTLANLGTAALRLNSYELAVSYLKQALALLQKASSRSAEAHVLADLGIAVLQQGHSADAADHLQDALAMFRAMGDRNGEAEALNGLGEVFLALGQPDRSRAQYAAALTTTSETGDAYEQARALDGLGRARHEPPVMSRHLA